MKSLIQILLLGSLMVAPSVATAWSPPPIKVDAGINARFNVYVYDYQKPLAPWYTYWPVRAHFQTPAPTGGFYPNWPTQWPPTGNKKETPSNGPGKSSTQVGPHVYSNPTNPYSNTSNTHQTFRPYYHGAGAGYSHYATNSHYQQPYYSNAPSYWYGH